MQPIDSSYAEKLSFAEVEHTHTHSFGHLVLPLQGILTLQAGQNSMLVDEQHLLLLPPECEHSYYARERNEFLVFYISEVMFSRNGTDQVKYADFDARWRALRFLMLSECQTKKNNTTSMNQLLYYAFQLLEQNQEAPSVRYLQENYQRNISLETLAALEHYHVGYYSQWFQKKMGVSVQTYLQQLRLREAKQLLRETNYSILDVAQLVGYEQQASLTRVFKHFEGMTPSAYRRNSVNR